MVTPICADKRIGDPLENMSLSDCCERCEGEEECEFHTFIPAETEDFSNVRNCFEIVTTRKHAKPTDNFSPNQLLAVSHFEGDLQTLWRMSGTSTGDCGDNTR